MATNSSSSSFSRSFCASVFCQSVVRNGHGQVRTQKKAITIFCCTLSMGNGEHSDDT
ncbi:Uncharacterized protein APZ42_012113 [Daphnia magna]|uniref:Uncharacterized protein n=1 Tax=Daphnia magna TaxID=35525 RepID=A0A162S2J2_9CRUS|nr:Uncharacterized protein APZ42_012113 [Daphnia magna]